jgi:hypothetical protein
MEEQEDNRPLKGLYPMLKINIAAKTEEHEMATIQELMEAFDLPESPVEFIKKLLDAGYANIYLHSWDESLKLM